jgi:exoribonuclease R
LARSFAELRTAYDLPTGFPDAVTTEAAEAARDAPMTLPETDLSDIDFVTIDPIGSTDLDQALHIERTNAGFHLRYAIADVPALVVPGGAVDAEARRRGQTVYAADGRILLHPEVLTDDVGSLRAGQLRSAYVWDFELDSGARPTSYSVRRARVRSRRQLDYAAAQAAIDDGSASETLQLLKVVGEARIERERERGGASLNSPDEEIVERDGSYTLERRESLPVEDWNAQISLLTGMAAAEVMLAGRIGILRTMPPASEDAVSAFRLQTVALGKPWPADQPYGEYLRTLDGDDPSALAIRRAATGLFRGAGYAVMNGSMPEITAQSAVGAPYAHTTAPLRRLVDRWVLVICEALTTGSPVPQWARDSLDTLPAIMATTSRVAAQFTAASVDRVEAALLADRVGESFAATVLSVGGKNAVVQLRDPAVTASIAATDGLAAGTVVSLTLKSVAIAEGVVVFVLASGAERTG